MHLNKKVTILMAAYNAGNFINDSINSLLNQTYQDFDLLIINDGSTDDTEDKILAFTDEKIKYLKNKENLGVGESVYKGMLLIDSKYIVRFDADDIAYSTWVQSLVSFMESNPNIALSSCLYDVIGGVSSENKRIENPLQIRTRSLFHCPIAQYIIIDNEFLKENRITYNPNLRVAIDYDLYLKVLRKGDMAKIPETLVKYRRHKSSLTSQSYKLQDTISTNLKLDLLKELTGVILNKIEREVYMDFTFHRQMGDANKLNLLKPTLFKIRNGYFNQTQYGLDKKYYSYIEYDLLRILLIQNKTLGFSIFYVYLKNYLFDFNIFMGFGLALRILKYKFNT